MAQVFFSYATADRAKVLRIIAGLEAEGFTVWWDQTLSAGDRWTDEIEQQLEDSDCIIVTWSNASLKSRWVKREARFAEERELLLPILIDNVRPPFEFSDVLWVDLTNWAADPASSYIDPIWRNFIGSVRKMAGPPARQSELADLPSNDTVPDRIIESFVPRERYNEVVQKLTRIVSHYVDNPSLSYNIGKLNENYFIRANGDTIVRRHIEIEVLSEDLPYFYVNIAADPDSLPMYDLDEINFEAYSSSDEIEIEFIATINEPLQKTIVIFFLPQCKKGQVIVVNIEYMWRGLLNELITKGSTEFRWDYYVSRPTKSFDLEIQLTFQDTIGFVNCYINHLAEEQESIEKIEAPSSISYIYRNPLAEAANRTYRIFAEIEKH